MRGTESKLCSFALPIVLASCGGSSEPNFFNCQSMRLPPSSVTLQGGVSVQNNQALDKVVGTLYVCELDTAESLPNLVSAGDVVVFGRSPGILSLPKLKTVGDVTISGDGPQVSLPELAQISTIHIFNNYSAWDLKLPLVQDLDAIIGALARDGVVGTVFAPELQTLGWAQLASYLDAPKLETVDGTLDTYLRLHPGADVFPALRQVEHMALRATSSSTGTIVVPLLETANQLAFEGPGPTRIEMPALHSANRLYIDGMPDLASIDFPSLQSLDVLSVERNPLLSGCEIDDLMAQVQPATVSVEGNGPPCP